jgi:hypothetical protein
MHRWWRSDSGSVLSRELGWSTRLGRRVSHGGAGVLLELIFLQLLRGRKFNARYQGYLMALFLAPLFELESMSCQYAPTTG